MHGFSASSGSLALKLGGLVLELVASQQAVTLQHVGLDATASGAALLLYSWQ